MPGVQAVVFDLDDTLFEERQFAFSGFDAVVSRFGDELRWGDRQAARLRTLYDTDQRGRAFDALLEECGVDSERRASLIERMVECFRQHRPRISLFPDADAALSRLAGKYRLGILSDGFLATQRGKIRALGVENRVLAIILTDEWGRSYWKPHPKGFDTISTVLWATPESCVYVADNPMKDFLAPNRLGWRTVRILRERTVYAHERAPEGGSPHYEIHTLNALDSCLQ